MNVVSILGVKGAAVVTIGDGASLADAVLTLRDNRIGAIVVSNDGQHIDGIVSERDIVRALAAGDGRVVERRVAEIMTREVTTCSPTDPVKSLMELMTHQRIRHLPVVANGVLVGIVSIGDVLKHRLDELELEANVMRDYAVAARH